MSEPDPIETRVWDTEAVLADTPAAEHGPALGSDPFAELPGPDPLAARLEVLERLKREFPKEICTTVLGYHVRIDEAQSRGLSIFEYAPTDRGAQALAAVAEELEARAPEAAREAWA